jgi:hypothetical protein
MIADKHRKLTLHPKKIKYRAEGTENTTLPGYKREWITLHKTEHTAASLWHSIIVALIE